jgi:predicted dehydrogenase
VKPIRIAIIGYGKIAADQHVPSIQGNDRLELVATSSRSGQGVARTFTDWRELVRGVEGLAAVAITSPPRGSRSRASVSRRAFTACSKSRRPPASPKSPTSIASRRGSK